MLAQRAVEDSPRWTRAVEDQSDPITERQSASSGGTFISFDARSEGQPRPLSLREVKESERLVGRAHLRINQVTLENEVEVKVTRAVGDCHFSGWWLSPSDSPVRSLSRAECWKQGRTVRHGPQSVRWFGTRGASRTTRASRGAVRTTRSVARTFALTGGIGRRATGALTKTVRVHGVVRDHCTMNNWLVLPDFSLRIFP